MRRVCSTGEDHVVFWKRGNSVLSMNERLLVSQPSLTVDNQPSDADDVVVYVLRLDSVVLEDEGDYSCQVLAQPRPITQRHRIVVNGQFWRRPGVVKFLHTPYSLSLSSKPLWHEDRTQPIRRSTVEPQLHTEGEGKSRLATFQRVPIYSSISLCLCYALTIVHNTGTVLIVSTTGTMH